MPPILSKQSLPLTQNYNLCSSLLQNWYMTDRKKNPPPCLLFPCSILSHTILKNKSLIPLDFGSVPTEYQNTSRIVVDGSHVAFDFMIVE